MSPPWMTRLEVPAVKSLMRVFPQSVTPEASLGEVRRMMLEDGVRYLAVENDGVLVGLLSSSHLSPDLADEVTAREVMTSDPLIVDLNQPVDGVLLEMARRHFDAALVTRGEHLAGVFTALDGCRGFARLLRHRAGAPDDGDDGDLTA